MTNPFFEPSTLPYGLPPFALIADDHYRPAFDRGFAQQRDEVSAIVDSRDAPTIENTVIALERSGQILSRVCSVFFSMSSAHSSPFISELEEELSPRLAAHADSITLNATLFDRVRTVWDAVQQDPAVDPETRYLVQRYVTEMTLAGAGLADAEKLRLRQLNELLAAAETKFEKNLLADSNDLAVVIDSVAELDGLSTSQISGAAAAATERGLDGKFLLTLVLPTGHPALSRLTDRSVRERVMWASRARGNRGNEWDNSDLVLTISRLRAERAELLGFPSHAAWVTADQTAGSPDAVATMFEGLAPAAARNVRAEQAELEDVAGHPIASWDWPFYAEVVRRQRHNIDSEELQNFFEADRVLIDGVFFAATRLYGVTFAERTDLVGYLPEVRVFEVFEQDGSGVGLFLLDLFTRDSKRGGAWMNEFVAQSFLLDSPVVVANNLNVPKPAEGHPALLTLDEVETLFHEFGHALHGLFARVRYPKFAGTNVFRDFVEFPSQVNEMWMLFPEVVSNFAVHHESGDALPAAVIEQLRASSLFNQGFETAELLSAALLDQAWHCLGSDATVSDVAEFEHAALAAVGLDFDAVPPRYSSTYFAHTFSGGYDAGYYSYLWSEVLDADAVEWFRENGGLTRENGDRFRAGVLGVGGSVDPMEAYRAFRGRDARVEPLLARRGLV